MPPSSALAAVCQDKSKTTTDIMTAPESEARGPTIGDMHHTNLQAEHLTVEMAEITGLDIPLIFELPTRRFFQYRGSPDGLLYRGVLCGTLAYLRTAWELSLPVRVAELQSFSPCRGLGVAGHDVGDRPVELR